MTILATERLSIAFGGVRAVDAVSLEIGAGQVFSIIGPNGAGKTTLFNLISGIYAPNDGQVWLAGEDVTALTPDRLARRGLSRTFQNLQIFFRMTAIENVMVGCHRHERGGLIAELLHLPVIARQNDATLHQAHTMLARVGLEQEARRPAGALSYGALKRLEIARALAAEPSVLLLDEPAAGVPTEESRELLETIAGLPRDVSIVLIEHDMDLVFRFADRISVLVGGAIVAEDVPEKIAADPKVQEVYLGEAGHG
jgi:branched-chain amino acid transport system ATP-binding protein